MTVGPRILFARFVDGNSPKLRPWIAHLSRVIAGYSESQATDGSLAQGAVVWRLFSGNNREIARGSRVHGSFEAAAAEARQVVDSVASLEIVEVNEPGKGDFGWYVTAEGEPVMLSSRWYASERDRIHAVALALAVLPAAVILSGSRLIHPSLLHSRSERELADSPRSRALSRGEF